MVMDAFTYRKDMMDSRLVMFTLLHLSVNFPLATSITSMNRNGYTFNMGLMPTENERFRQLQPGFLILVLVLYHSCPSF
jgi:hypothetical protein